MENQLWCIVQVAKEELDVNLILFVPSLIGTVALTKYVYLLIEYCISPIFDLNLLRVATRMAAWAAARELSSDVNNGTNPCL